MDSILLISVFIAPIVIYLLVRVASAGYFRSRLFYDKLKSMQDTGDEEDG